MTPATIIKGAMADGVSLALSPSGTVKVAGDQAAVTRWLPAIRQHKPDIIEALKGAGNDAIPAAGWFEFSPPNDPVSDAEVLQELAAIVAGGCGMDQAQALREARWHVRREQCWRGFLRNAQRILDSPDAGRSGLVQQYKAEAERRFGRVAGGLMATEMRGWISARGVH